MNETVNEIRRCICRHRFDVHGPSGCHATMTITPVRPDESGRIPCECKRWPPEAAAACDTITKAATGVGSDA